MLDTLNLFDYPHVNRLAHVLDIYRVPYYAFYRHPSGYLILEYIRREPPYSSLLIYLMDPIKETQFVITGASSSLPHNNMGGEQIRNMEWNSLEYIRKIIEREITTRPFTK